MWRMPRMLKLAIAVAALLTHDDDLSPVGTAVAYALGVAGLTALTSSRGSLLTYGFGLVSAWRELDVRLVVWSCLLSSFVRGDDGSALLTHLADGCLLVEYLAGCLCIVSTYSCWAVHAAHDARRSVFGSRGG